MSHSGEADRFPCLIVTVRISRCESWQETWLCSMSNSRHYGTPLQTHLASSLKSLQMFSFCGL